MTDSTGEARTSLLTMSRIHPIRSTSSVAMLAMLSTTRPMTASTRSSSLFLVWTCQPMKRLWLKVCFASTRQMKMRSQLALPSLL